MVVLIMGVIIMLLKLIVCYKINRRFRVLRYMRALESIQKDIKL